VAAYYYFIAQLPFLSYGQPAPMPPDYFRAMARDMLSPSDAALLDYCALDPDAALRGAALERGDKGAGAGPPYGEIPPSADSSFIDGWYAWERALRLQLARYRAQSLKRDGAAPVDPPASPPEAEAAAKAALALESPLEAEILLDRARWDAIEALEGLDYFGRNTVYAYLLKLLLMERRSAFKPQEGFAEYKALYASIMEQVSVTGERFSEESFNGAAPTSIESGEPK
jgi:hypothetical protein